MLIKTFLTRWKCNIFFKETRQILKKLDVTQQDIIFIPNTLSYSLQGLIELFKKEPRFVIAEWHLLFHMEFDEFSGKSTSGLTDADVVRQLLQELQQAAKNCRIYLYTDSEQLTDYYNTLGVYTFETLPIPIDKRYFLEKKKDFSEPVQISYVGAARSNKGYQYLPSLIAEFAQERSENKIAFSIQSNLNSIEGDPQILAARSELEVEMDNVTILSEAMSPDEYRNVVLNSDAVLIPYDVHEYQRRTSGIFAECMAAGIPVIIPSGSWMMLQLNQVMKNYHDQLISNYLISKTVISNITPIPKKATHFVIQQRIDEIKIRFFNEKNIIDEKIYFIRNDSSLYTLPKNISTMQIVSDDDIEVCFLQLITAPSSTVALVYHEPAQLADCIRSLRKHYPHYKNTATLFAHQWIQYHNPDELIATIISV